MNGQSKQCTFCTYCKQIQCLENMHLGLHFQELQAHTEWFCTNFVQQILIIKDLSIIKAESNFIQHCKKDKKQPCTKQFCLTLNYHMSQPKHHVKTHWPLCITVCFCWAEKDRAMFLLKQLYEIGSRRTLCNKLLSYLQTFTSFLMECGNFICHWALLLSGKWQFIVQLNMYDGTGKSFNQKTLR